MTEHIEHYLMHLMAKWDFNVEELDDIRSQMAAYAVDCIMDSHVADEAMKINEELV